MGLFLHYLSLPYLRQGIVFTLEVTGLGLAGGLLVGLVLAGMQLSRFRLLSGLRARLRSHLPRHPAHPAARVRL